MSKKWHSKITTKITQRIIKHSALRAKSKASHIRIRDNPKFRGRRIRIKGFSF